MNSYTVEVLSNFILSDDISVKFGDTLVTAIYNPESKDITVSLSDSDIRFSNISLILNGSVCAHIHLAINIDMTQVKEFVARIFTSIDYSEGIKIELSTETAYRIHRQSDPDSHVQGALRSTAIVTSERTSFDFEVENSGKYGNNISSITPSNETTIALGVETTDTDFNEGIQVPSEYTKGGCLINKGRNTIITLQYYPKVTDIIELIVRIPLPKYNSQALLGTISGTSPRNGLILRVCDFSGTNPGDVFCYARSQSTEDLQQVIGFAYYNQLIKIRIHENVFQILDTNDNLIEEIRTPNSVASTSDTKLSLFGINNNGVAEECGCEAEIYSMRVWNADRSQLIRQYVPCISNSSQIPGLWDTVEGRFNYDANHYSDTSLGEILPGNKRLDKTVGVACTTRFNANCDFIESPYDIYRGQDSEDLGYSTWLYSDEVHGLYLGTTFPNMTEFFMIGSTRFPFIQSFADGVSFFSKTIFKPTVLRHFNNTFIQNGNNILVFDLNPIPNSERLRSTGVRMTPMTIENKILMPTSDFGYLAYDSDGNVYNLLKVDENGLVKLDLSGFDDYDQDFTPNEFYEFYEFDRDFGDTDHSVSKFTKELVRSMISRNISKIKSNSYFNLPAAYYDEATVRYKSGVGMEFFVSSDLNSATKDILDTSVPSFRSYRQINELKNLQLDAIKVEIFGDNIEIYYKYNGSHYCLSGRLSDDHLVTNEVSYITLHHRGVSVKITTDGKLI